MLPPRAGVHYVALKFVCGPIHVIYFVSLGLRPILALTRVITLGWYLLLPTA
jgi:hypothetical protein